MRKVWAILLGLVVVTIAAGAVEAASIGITFGNGSQGPTGAAVGPGAAQTNWNIIDVRSWDGGGWSYGTNSDGYGPNNSSTPTSIGFVDSSGATLTTPITIQGYDAGQAAACSNNGAYGGWGGNGSGASIGLGANPWDQQFAIFQTSANTPPANRNCTLSFFNIPYTTYDVYIGGQNLYTGSVWGSGTLINGAVVLTGQTGSTFTTVAQWGHPYDGLGGKISYVQFVDASAPPVTIADATWASDATTGSEFWTTGTWTGTGTLPPNEKQAKITVGNANTQATIDLGTSDKKVGQITFNGDVATTIQAATTSPGTLNLDNDTAASVIQVNHKASTPQIHAISAPVALNSAGLDIKVVDATDQLTLSGAIEGVGPLTLNAANLGKVVLSGTDTNIYSGTTTVNAGTLKAAAANKLSADSDMVVSGGTLDVTGGVQTVKTLTMTSGTLDLSIGSLLTSTGLATFGGTLSLTGSYPTAATTHLIQYGDHSGTFTLAAPLPANYSLTYGSGAGYLDLVYTAPGPPTWATNDWLGKWSDTANWTGNTVPNAPGAEAIFNNTSGGEQMAAANASITLGSLTLGGADSVTIAGTKSATLTLQGSESSPTATVHVSGGTHELLLPVNVNSDAAITVAEGSTLEIGQPLSIGAVDVSVSGNVQLDSWVDIAEGGVLLQSGNLLGAGSLVKTGEGEMVLSGNNQYAGGTVVTGGTLTIASATALPAGKSLSIGSGGTLILGGGMAMGTSAQTAEPVPEPGTLALLAIAGLAAVMIWRKRK